MDYIKQLEAFYSKLNYNTLTSNAMNLYQVILFIANQAKRTDELSIANTRLMSICNLTLKQFQSARNELITKKYIDYKKGGNQNIAPKYCILILTRNDESEKGNAEGIALVRAEGIAEGKAQGIPDGYINKTRLDLLFNYFNNTQQDFFEDGKRTINLQDKAFIILHLKRLQIYVDNTDVLELFTEVALTQTKIFYWIIKELYFSSYKVYLKELTYKTLCLKYLKAKEYTNADIEFNAERLIAYTIKSLQEEFKKKEQKNVKNIK